MANKSFKAVEGEFGFVHTFNVKEEDGTAADISWADTVRLVIIDEDDSTTKLDTTANMTIVPNDKVQWTVPSGALDFSSDNLNLVLHFSLSTSRLEKTYDFPGEVAPKKV